MRFLTIVFTFVLMTSTTFGASYTINRNGINSKATGLDGTGVRIGQAEGGRAGKFDKDATGDSAENTFPTQVYIQGLTFGGVDGASSPNITDHATAVAGVMIGRPTPLSLFEGVAPQAQLHSVAALGSTSVVVALSLDRIADLSGAPIRAINMSFGVPLSFPENVDGNSHLTQYVDWSAGQHNVVYVAAWPNFDVTELHAPSDNFNGITVAASQQFTAQSSVYGKFAATNQGDIFSLDALGGRTSIDILAPGEEIRVLEKGSVDQLRTGTSYAAPHVTGAIALMHQHMTNQGVPTSISVDARQHEVTKAILLNSADKLSGVHGSSRTILDKDDKDWTESEAFSSRFQSLDDQMGAGHLNVKSAIDQFDGGQHSPGNVDNIGWAWDGVGVGGRDEYFLPAGSSGYISITLAWDRELEITGFGDDNYNAGDQFFVNELNNLNLYLMTADGTDLLLDSPVRSTTLQDNVEHIFSNDYPAGDYKIVVEHAGGSFGGFGEFQNYGLAWRLGNDLPPLDGDNDGDGDVDGDDFDIFQSEYGTGTRGDADLDGDTDGADFLAWQRNFSGPGALSSSTQVPEPTCLMLLVLGLPLLWKLSFPGSRLGTHCPRGSASRSSAKRNLQHDTLTISV